MELQKNLIAFRNEKKLTQQALARSVGLKQQSISRWETGQNIPNVLDCVILADFYEISLDELVGRNFDK
jgi:transcriptional regulator with XRE-family HTH domain